MSRRERGNREGTVYRRKDGRWVAAITLGWVNGKLSRKTATAATKAAAKRKLTELQAAAAQGLALTADPTIAAYLNRWLEDSARRKLRPRTFNDYCSIVRGHLIPGLGRIQLRRLRPGDLDVYLKRGADAGLSKRRLQLIHAVLRSALSEAERLELVSRNVAKLIVPPAPARRRVEPLTPEQARRFLDSVKGDRLATLYSLALETGARQGELLGLAWQDIDFVSRTLTVRHSLQYFDKGYHLTPPKTENSKRTISLSVPLVDALKRHKAAQQMESYRVSNLWNNEWDLVFTNECGVPSQVPKLPADSNGS